jgi:hypothetical protein
MWGCADRKKLPVFKEIVGIKKARSFIGETAENPRRYWLSSQIAA